MKQLTLHLKSLSGVKDNLPRSDTLFGAICWGLKILFSENDLQKFLEIIQKDPLIFLISSAFPFIVKNSFVKHFFPKPYLIPLPTQSTKDSYKIAKKFNKAIYVDELLFQEIIDNGYNNQDLFEKLVKGELSLSQDNKILSKEKDLTIPIKSETIPGNAVDRLQGGTIEGKLYHTNELFFNKDSGLFIMLKVSDELVNKIIAIFRYYGEKGLGGDSSVGKGTYTLEIKEGFPITENTNGKRWINLSLYYPTNEEWQYYQANQDDVWYSITKRKGKVESSYSPTLDIWKKSVLMIEEGSTFPVINGKTTYGTLPVVKEISDNYNVLQYGLAFTFRMR